MGQIAKDKYISRKLGQNNFPSQQTTRAVFDTHVSATNVLEQDFTFFKNFAGKGPGATNLTQGKLDSSESMIIKNITFYVGNTSAGTLLGVQNGAPVIFDVYVGNQRVIKDYPMHLHSIQTQNYAPYRFQGTIPNTVTEDTGTRYVYAMRCITDIVIPGDVNFSVVVKQAASINSGDGLIFVRCEISGYGQLFNAGSSY